MAFFKYIGSLNTSIILSVALHAVFFSFAFTSAEFIAPAPLRPPETGIEISIIKESDLPSTARLNLSAAALGPLAPKAIKGDKKQNNETANAPSKIKQKDAETKDVEQKQEVIEGTKEGESENSLEKKQREVSDTENLLKTVETLRSKERVKDSEKLAQLTEVDKEKAVPNEELLAAAIAGLDTQGKKGPVNNNDTAGLLANVSNHYARCWKIPSGTKGIEDLTVELLLQFDPTGNTNRAKIVIENKNDQKKDLLEFRMLAESALRAVWHPKCNPLALPKDRYDEWKQIIIVFDPRKAVG